MLSVGFVGKWKNGIGRSSGQSDPVLCRHEDELLFSSFSTNHAELFAFILLHCFSRKRALCNASQLHRFTYNSTLSDDRRECPQHRSTTRLIQRSPWIVVRCMDERVADYPGWHRSRHDRTVATGEIHIRSGGTTTISRAEFLAHLPSSSNVVSTAFPMQICRRTAVSA